MQLLDFENLEIIWKQSLLGPKRAQYYAVSYRNGGKTKHLKVHILVAHLFVYNPMPKVYTKVNHRNGNKLINAAWNLEWTDDAGNSQHAVDTGLNPKKGSSHHNAKLDEDSIKIIRSLFWHGKMTQTAISIAFDIDQSVISKIVHNKIWKHAA